MSSSHSYRGGRRGRAMSTNYGERHGRGGGRGRGGGSHASYSNSFENPEGGSGHSTASDRHPPHLKGRDIGLWYAKHGGGKKKTKDHLPKIELSPNKKLTIISLVQKLKEKHSQSLGSSGGDSDFMQRYKQNIFDNLSASSKSISFTPELVRQENLDQALKLELEEKQNNHKYQNMMRFREKLPTNKFKDEFIQLLSKNQVIVISGETGCGKTTQCCQLILDEMIKNGNGSLCKIVCTQPRRISAITVAERVASERAEPIGKSVGYSIRLESRFPSNERGSILFCTTGVIFQYLKTDPLLSDFSHILVDEIHERDVLSDFLVTILKDLIKIRPDLKVILMSATINAEHFSRYFGNCPCFAIPGFTFPVQDFFLEDVLEKTQFTFGDSFVSNRGLSSSHGGNWRNRKFQNQDEDSEYKRMLEVHLRKLDREKAYPRSVIAELKKPESEVFNLDLIEQLLRYICKTDKANGAVLVFVPGWEQISKLHSQMISSGSFPETKYLLIPLHSMMPTVNQRDVFERPPAGKRKIIISTNIAETSITIDDIVFVVDAGKIKLTNFDLKRNIESLDTEWVSLANATQRRGRAGRVQEGVCYHLFNKAREMTLERFKKPEILRKRLEEVVLQIKMLKLGNAGEFLNRLMDPPSNLAVELAVKRLIQLNALDADENLTPLGFHLAHLPMDPQTGKMILMGAIFGCLDPILTVAASLSFKDGFYIPLGKEKAVDRIRKGFSGDTKSDHLVTVHALAGYENACRIGREKDFCYRNFLSRNTMQLLNNMKGQFAQHLFEMKFIANSNYKSIDSNIHSSNVALVKAVICAGLYPNVANVRVKRKRNGTLCYPQIRTSEDGRVELHPKSVNTGMQEFESPFLMYFQKMKSSSIFLYDTTLVSPFPLIFFGGELKYKVDQNIGIVDVDYVVELKIDKDIFELVQALRGHLDRLLEEKVSNPGPTCWNVITQEGALLSAITELITTEYQQMFGEDDFDSDSDDEYSRKPGGSSYSSRPRRM